MRRHEWTDGAFRYLARDPKVNHDDPPSILWGGVGDGEASLPLDAPSGGVQQDVLAAEILRLVVREKEARERAEHYDEIVRLRSVVDGLEERVRELEGTIAMRDGTLAMAVARLGGEVEGAPTHRGNFLQRIDELRRMEEETQLLRRRNDTQAETIGIYLARQDADRARIAELEEEIRTLTKRK